VRQIAAPHVTPKHLDPRQPWHTECIVCLAEDHIMHLRVLTFALSFALSFALVVGGVTI
jgi:hypothetical protein